MEVLVLVWGEDAGFCEMGHMKDTIGWRQFMEGMILKEIIPIQEDYVDMGGSTLSFNKWAQGLIVKLLEVLEVTRKQGDEGGRSESSYLLRRRRVEAAGVYFYVIGFLL